MKIVTTDFDTQYAIRYEPRMFETNKFSVELDKGMLKAVNSESTPGPKAAVESLQGLVDIRKDILTGFVKASETTGMDALKSVTGEDMKAAPIACSTNQ